MSGLGVSMVLADVAKKETTTRFSFFSSVFPFEIQSPTSLLGVAFLGPCLILLTIALSSSVPGLPLMSSAIAIMSMMMLLRWKEKGFLGALSLVALGYMSRAFFSGHGHLLWEFGFFFSKGLGVYIARQCFEECIEVYERDTISIAEDFEKLKEVHATYTHEKAVECERLKVNLKTKEGMLAENNEEIESLKNVVFASSAQASSFAQKNAALQETVFELHKSTIELRAQKKAPSIDAQMLKELNTLRVDNFQREKFINHVLTIVHPLKVDVLAQPKQEAIATPDVATVEKETLEQEPSPEKKKLLDKEKAKARIKKNYYKYLDMCNTLKATCSKDLSNEAAKKEYDEASTLLKEKKAELVAVEKELFSLKKELRDQGKLYSST